MLANILADPGGDHTVAVGQHLHVVLRDAHVASIVRAFERELAATGSFSRSHLGFNAGTALHTILYHLLGGATTDIYHRPRSWPPKLRAIGAETAGPKPRLQKKFSI